MRKTDTITIGTTRWVKWELVPGELLLYSHHPQGTVQDSWATEFTLIESPPMPTTLIAVDKDADTLLESFVPFGSAVVFKEKAL